MKKVNFLIILLSTLAFSACQVSTKDDNKKQITNNDSTNIILKDYGAEPLVLNIEEYTLGNDNFRTALWTGMYFQVTLMSIPVGGEVGLEIHHDIEQFLRIEEGMAEVFMGDKEDELTFVRKAGDDDAIFVPAGKWHNVINKGDKPLKLYSIYAKPEHPHGTIHADKAASDADEHDH